MAVVMTEVMGLPRGRGLTREDLAAMPDDGHRYELLDGVLVVSPAPTIRHQWVVAALLIHLNRACPADLKVLTAPVDVVLTPDTVIQPDLIVAARDAFTERDLPGPPALAVEVLSPSTRGVDLLLKKDRLRRAGCRHYWVVDPDGPSITTWVLDDGEYRQGPSAVGDEELVVAEPLRISLVPSALLD